MGIQGFFRHFKDLSNKITNSSDRFIVDTVVSNDVSRLYIDFLSILIDLIIDNPNELNNNREGTPELLINKMIDKLRNLFSLYPNAVIYIFFEGIPTVGKIIEQYYRKIYRKISNDIKKDLQNRLNVSSNEFDFNLFTYNSPYLIRVADRINSVFSTEREINIFTFNPEINEIGEAEHRIIHHIVSNPYNSSDKFVIYSPDADVFLLSTLLTNNIKKNGPLTVNTVKREDFLTTGQTTRKLDTINSNLFIKYLLNQIDERLILDKEVSSRVIADIIFLFNILGSDFIPSFNNFGVDNIVLIYSGYKELGIGTYILDLNPETNKFSINSSNLLNFFKSPSIQSIDGLKFKSSKPPLVFPIENDKIPTYITNKNNEISNNPKTYYFLSYYFDKGFYFYKSATGKNDNNFSNFLFINHTINPLKIDYNKKLYSFKNLVNLPLLSGSSSSTASAASAASGSEIIQVVEEYLKGYQFLLDMYFNDYGVVKNNFWYYPYQSTPTVQQIVEYIEANRVIPSYINPANRDVRYFNSVEYDKFLNEQTTINYQIVLNDINLGLNLRTKITSIGYDDLILFTSKDTAGNLIFNCDGEKFLNKCKIKNQIILNPIEFINKERLGSTSASASASSFVPAPNTTVPPTTPTTTASAASATVHDEGFAFQIPGNRLVPQTKFVGGGNDRYYQKYLKYKTKYLELQKKYKIV